MNIILTSVEEPLAEAWERFCGDLDFVTVRRGSIFDVVCDAVVSPANSFGFMDGGIDPLYSQYFGWQVQDRLQDITRDQHQGELLVRAAEIVETDARQVREAIDSVLLGPCPFPQSWAEAQIQHQMLYTGSFRDLQRE